MTSLRAAASTVMSGCSGGACRAGASAGSPSMRHAQKAMAKRAFNFILLNSPYSEPVILTDDRNRVSVIHYGGRVVKFQFLYKLGARASLPALSASARRRKNCLTSRFREVEGRKRAARTLLRARRSALPA